MRFVNLMHSTLLLLCYGLSTGGCGCYMVLFESCLADEEDLSGIAGLAVGLTNIALELVEQTDFIFDCVVHFGRCRQCFYDQLSLQIMQNVIILLLLHQFESVIQKLGSDDAISRLWTYS